MSLTRSFLHTREVQIEPLTAPTTRASLTGVFCVGSVCFASFLGSGEWRWGFPGRGAVKNRPRLASRARSGACERTRDLTVTPRESTARVKTVVFESPPGETVLRVMAGGVRLVRAFPCLSFPGSIPHV